MDSRGVVQDFLSPRCYKLNAQRLFLCHSVLADSAVHTGSSFIASASFRYVSVILKLSSIVSAASTTFISKKSKLGHR